MKLILETTDTNYYLTTSREYYSTVGREEELIVLKDRLGNLQDWVYTLSCAERLGIVQYDTEGNRFIVGNNHTMNPFTLTRVTCRF